MALPVVVTPLVPRVFKPRRAEPDHIVRPTRAEINLGNLRHNLRVLRRYAQTARIYGVLKADGYGHGAPAVARTLERAGIDGICVALLEEGIELRNAGIRSPIVVMGGYYGTSWSELLAHRLTPVLYDASQVQALAREVRYCQTSPVAVHLKVDTGMSRLGVRPEKLASVLDALAATPEVQLQGMMTHLASADSDDLSMTHQQCERFDDSLRLVQQRGINLELTHAANSAGLMNVPRSHYSMVRPGIALFGVAPRSDLSSDLRPVMRVRSEIVALRNLPEGEPAGYCSTWHAQRPSHVATVPMGYADGLPRSLSNCGRVLVRGRAVPIVGNVSMDLITIDVTDVPGVGIGDEVVVLGSQQGPLGSDTITAHEIAGQISTISWEILTGISRRVPRFYREP